MNLLNFSSNIRKIIQIVYYPFKKRFKIMMSKIYGGENIWAIGIWRCEVEQCENIVKIWGDRWSSSHEVGCMWRLLKCGKIKQKRKNLRMHMRTFIWFKCGKQKTGDNVGDPIVTLRCSFPNPTWILFHFIPLIAPQSYIHLRWHLSTIYEKQWQINEELEANPISTIF